MKEIRDYTCSHRLIYPSLATLERILEIEKHTDNKSMDAIKIDSNFESFEENIFTSVLLVNENVSNRVIGFWDTGANICSISRHSVKRLHLETKKSKGKIKTANGIKTEVEITTVGFVMPNGNVINVQCDVMGDDEPFDFVIGMNVIKHGTFTIKPTANGYNFKFE